MAQNHIGELNVRRLPAAIPQVTNEINLYPDQDKKWGLGFMINTQPTAEGRSAEELKGELEPAIRADYPSWDAPEWIGFAVESFYAELNG